MENIVKRFFLTKTKLIHMIITYFPLEIILFIVFFFSYKNIQSKSIKHVEKLLEPFSTNLKYGQIFIEIPNACEIQVFSLLELINRFR